jgi:regulator of sirC expression with transglutaminase-like and TPR domain
MTSGRFRKFMGKVHIALRVCCLLLVCAGWSAAQSATDPLAALTPIAKGSARIELGPVALDIAHALNASIDTTLYARHLNALVSEMGPAFTAATNPKAKLEVMEEYIYRRWGFADRNSLPADVFVSFVDVLDKRQWNCFGMSVLYIALGDRLGVPLELVSGRGHVLVHCPNTPYFIETTQRGRVYDSIDYLGGYLPFPCLNPRDYRPSPPARP